MSAHSSCLLNFSQTGDLRLQLLHLSGHCLKCSVVLLLPLSSLLIGLLGLFPLLRLLLLLQLTLRISGLPLLL